MTNFIDIETKSSVDIKAGVYAYTQSPDFEILMAAWSKDGEAVHIAIGEDEIRQIPGLFTESWCAHNSQFERIALSVIAPPEELGPEGYLPPENWTEDTASLAAEHGYPRKLKDLAKALGAEEKDEAGTLLINWFCRPRKLRGRYTWMRPEDHPEKWDAFIDYCIQDVYTLIDVHRRLPGWPTEKEREVFLADQHVNDRGVRLDIELARAAVRAAEENRVEQIAEAQRLTGIANPNSNVQLLEWLNGSGLPMADVRKETVSAALEGALNHVQRRVLELRQELALVASKKYDAAIRSACDDGRLRGSLRFFGAHTGRWSGSGLQVQNLASVSVPLSDEDQSYVDALAKSGASEAQVKELESRLREIETELVITDLIKGGRASAQMLKALVRPLFVGPFSVVDYSQIEARVLAWLAGEQWVLDAFEQGRDLYVETAARMSTKTRTYGRKDGKIGVLAGGFGGGINSLRAFGAQGTDDELWEVVNGYRDANPKIVKFWHDLEAVFRTGGKAGRIYVERDGSDRKMYLPSGRMLTYHDVRSRMNAKGRKEIHFADPKGYRTGLYGGKLAENATQAAARDVMAEAIVRLEKAGLPVLLSVHDELVVDSTDVALVRKIMIEPPTWAEGLPIDASGELMRRYRK